MDQGPPRPTQRFSGRASAYARARPGYPEEMFDHLFAVGALFAGAEVADLGSGTGILSELLLGRGLRVYAIEPNQEMRSQAEWRLSGRPGFTSIAGTAERTSLPDGCVDAAMAAQSFHWFDIELTRQEMGRVLRPGGQVIMVWNNREKELDAFHSAYSELMERYARDKREVDRLREGPQERFFHHGYHHVEFRHTKDYDLEGLECLVTSASYMPKEGEEGYEEMRGKLRGLFARFGDEGMVRMHYRADCYHGRLD